MKFFKSLKSIENTIIQTDINYEYRQVWVVTGQAEHEDVCEINNKTDLCYGVLL